MLCNLETLTGYTLQATDGEIGRCKDFLFDDNSWAIRWMVADTHKWLPLGRKVLISPVSLGAHFSENKTIPVNLNRQTIEDSPHLDEHSPVSRTQERKLFEHFGYGYYWAGAGIWGAYPYPSPLMEPRVELDNDDGTAAADDSEDSHLRSFNEVKGYTVHAADGDIGHVDDIVIDRDDWKITFIIVDTHNWLPGGRKVVIASDFLGDVSWSEQHVMVNLNVAQIENSPLYVPDRLNDVDYQNILYEYYRFQRNWNDLKRHA